MANVNHTLNAAVNPTAAPPSIGAHYTNTVTGQTWLAIGTASVTDWGIPLPGKRRVLLNDSGNTDLVVDLYTPLTIWYLTNDLDHTLTFPSGPPGYYEVEFILQGNGNREVIVLTEIDDYYFKIPARLKLYNSNATYYKFALEVDIYNGSPCWTQVDMRILTGPYPMYVSKVDTGTELILTGNPQTLWVLPTAGARTLVLAQLDDEFVVTIYTEVELVVWNVSGAAVTITIDTTGSGLPLKDTPTLEVAAASCVRYRMAYFYGGAATGWTLVNTHVLTQ